MGSSGLPAICNHKELVLCRNINFVQLKSNILPTWSLPSVQTFLFFTLRGMNIFGLNSKNVKFLKFHSSCLLNDCLAQYK